MLLWQTSLTENNDNYDYKLLGAFAKLREAIISFAMLFVFLSLFSLRLYVCPTFHMKQLVSQVVCVYRTVYLMIFRKLYPENFIFTKT
jgi:hypothetical protein